MKTIVITGSTRGIGFHLADQLLQRGCQVVISGRSQAAVDQAAAELSKRYEARRIMCQACDVSQFEQLQTLWGAAVSRFGQVDIWINNAGIAKPISNLWEQSPEDVQQVIDTNVLGTMYGSMVSLRGFAKQGFGALYNLEGYGSTGRPMVNGLAPYGASKAAIHFLDDALTRELEGKPVIVGAIQPGMVATEMISSQYEGKPEEWERARKIFNIIADPPDEVAAWIADHVLSNDKNGARLARVSRAKMMGRFLMAPFRKREVFK